MLLLHHVGRSREQSSENLYYYFPERTVSSTMNDDANSFARHEPNAPPGQEEGTDQGAASAAFSPPWPGLGFNPLGPRLVLRLSTELPRTRLVPCQKKKRRVRQSLKTLRRSSRGECWLEIVSQTYHESSSRTGSRGLPLGKAWQDWFTIRLRTWANVISPFFEADLAKKVLGQQADLSRHGTAERQLAHEICFNIDDKMLPYLLARICRRAWQS